MGSQTLEILRQGVWASLTGGWFYDPHQNLFCNTVHLYVWLFLLCLPFSIYLYFPPASLGWIIYCALVALLFAGLKLLNHALHHMYDTSECIVVQPPTDPNSAQNPPAEEGMEMQMLKLGGAAATGSDNESVTSLEYHKPNNSTIDLKVDVHRKNSSESSIEDSAMSAKQTEVVAATKSDLCVAQAAEMPGPSKTRPANRSRSKSGHRREHRTSKRRTHGTRIDELIGEASRSARAENNLPVHMIVDEGPFAKVSRRYHECPHRRGSSNKDFFKEWLYLDGTEAGGEPYQSKFARQLSSDSRDNSEPSVGPPSPKKRTAHRRRYANYPDESCTKSAMALATQQSSNMRRNSNSTMSTIQLPLLNSTAQLVSHMRRHSNNADTGFFASVELGEYMMVKAEAPVGEAEKSKGKSSGFRRIKSAALEIGCPPPSVSNLSPHPNSAETIGGQMLKNPKNAVIPPPSKSLTRGPHLNLYPKNESGEGCSYPYLTYGSEIVYPIAEISDEMQTSQKETDLDSSGESYSDYDDEKQFRGFDWDAEQSPAMRSSDSDYENNGSRSPLLDRPSDVRVVRSKTHADGKKHCCERHTNKHNLDCPNDKGKPVRLKKLKHEPQYEAKRPERPAPCCECKNAINTNVDYFEKASATSKDLLIEKSSLESSENQDQPVKQSDEKKVVEKKPWDHDICNSSSSSDTYMDGPSKNFKNDKNIAPETEESQLTCDSKSADERSVYSLDWLFEESEQPKTGCCKEAGACALPEEILCQKLANALGESSSNVPKNLGAIPKQIKNLARSRASSQKENKKRDSKKEKDENQNEEVILFDAVEAQAALVQGLECLFAATNANTVVMPPTNREERPRSHRQSIRGERENSHKTRKRSIEEVAQTSTNTLLPTSMPLLAAFLNSRVDFGPCCLPSYVANATATESAATQTVQPAEEGPRLRPLMDRNHRNRVRKIKRSTRQRNNPSQQNNPEKKDNNSKPPAPDNSNNSNNVHFATSFDDTTDGAIHCFMDEYGNWMSYTFDKNSSGRAQATPIPLPEKEDQQGMRINRVKPIDNPDNAQETAGEGSCGSLESEAGNSESIPKKRGDSIDQSSSNQGSNNPLLSSNNNVSAVVPINTNNANKRFYVFDGGTGGSHADQPRSPVAYVTDSLLEQIEAERQSRMGLPSMHINFLMNQQRAQQLAQQQQAENTYANVPSLMPSIGEESVELNLRSKFSKLMDEMEKANQPKQKSYYKFKLSKCFELKVSMDRLQLMALFDRNLTCRETFVTIFLAVMVAVLGSMVLNLGFYRDIYAFWFCFIMAGSQYSLLKSVQPDSASPVHGFNKMVVFSRPVYFCICTALLCGVHSYLEQTAPFTDEVHTRRKRSFDDTKPITIYGFEMNERDFLHVIQEILSKFLLFFPLAFSLGLFPQVNTFLMYLLEQIDMHVFGGNATSSLSAAVYCVVRSVAAIGVLYGFAYSGLVEGKKSQHQKHNILFSIFCGLLVPIAYHLSRSASDYTLIWNLIKKHLLPPELYVIQNPECSPELDKTDPNTLSDDKKNNSESNISKQNSIGSSASKINFSSETNIAKQKRSQTSSVSSLKMDPRGDTMNSTTSLKADPPTEDDKTQDTNTSNVKSDSEKPDEDMEDPLPKKLQATVNARLKNDVIVCTFLGLFVFGLHCTTVFTTLRPQLNTVLWIIAGILGWALHYVTPQLRKQQPWLCLAGPVLKQHEHAQFEVTEPARLMCFEKMFVYLCFLERNVLYPGVVVAATTQDAPAIAAKYGDAVGALIICVCALKCLRNAYSEPDSQYLILVFAVLLFQRDLSSQKISETFLVDYFITAIIFSKVYEFLLKVQFVVTYIAPWQITWGSAFHAFAQPFSVPHSAMLFLQAAVSALLSSPLTPALGSAIFMTSYVRPVKFWERDYNTKRVDQSNTRLSSQLERNLGADDNNLNSIFYEHLTRSLQHYLCGDLMLGRWGQVQQGDCFVLASDYLNCLVHIVEMGNGLVSFQLRGLEFRGTYCQQREVEAISEGPEESSEGVCGGAWCVGGRALSLGAAWALRWLAWQLVAARYVLEGYSVSDNSAVSMLQVFDFRKVLLTYYVKSIIYYTIQSPKLEEWLASTMIADALKPMNERNFVDLDPIFNVNLDEDYDFRASGITRSRFCAIYGEWIAHCGARRGASWRRRAAHPHSPLTTLCFALSLLGRRALAAAQHLSASSVEFFLYGLHSLFKGDFRITCARDEWVFTDMSLLHSVLAPAIRMALKLHQDHFMFPEEYCSSSALYCAIASHAQRLVICHEAAPAWRYNVLRGAPHLLALRHVMDEGNDDYKIIMLNKRHLGFRVIKLNRECVRGLWAGQQQELVYLRNRNPERGSIQNAKQALRNIINSSCDQPIGYPIYVSPLTTSYADTSPQLCSLLGGPLTVSAIRARIAAAWRRIRRRCGEGCSSGGAPGAGDASAAEAGAARNNTPRHNALHLSRTSLAGTRGSLASAGKPTSSTLASLAGLLREHSHERTTHDETAAAVSVSSGGVLLESGNSHRVVRELSVPPRRERPARAARHSKEPARQGCNRSRMRRAAPASFRLLAASDNMRLEPTACSSHPNDETQSAAGSNWECAWRDQPRRAASAKVSSSRGGPSAESSLEDLTLTPTGLDLSLPDCKIIANRNARQDRDFKRYYVNEMTTKDLSKLSKEIRHERESYRELTGRYIEKPEAIPLKETHYSDLSNKESILKKESKKDSKAKEIKTKIKRSDSGRSELKVNVSVGSKVLIIEPLGVYDCINLGRRIDVQWPSEAERERGGRNFWGSWVPMAGMDGLVVHKWTPNHRDPKLRSHVDKSILLIQIDDKYVPIAENCVQDLGDEV